MILKIIPGLSAFNCLQYIHKEGAQPIASNMAGHDMLSLKREFALVNSLNPLKHQIVHLIIVHPLGEQVSREQAIHEVAEALAGLGYADCPFTALEHFDSGKQHFHIATTPVDFDGKRIERGGDRFAAKRICRRLELEAGLQIVSNDKGTEKKEVHEVATPEIQAADLSAALYAAILPAIQRSKTIGDLAQDLLRHGVQMEASFGSRGASGLGYRLLGDRRGYLNASEVHSSFTLAKLKNKHHLNYDSDRDDKHLVQMTRRPSQPVHSLLAAMAEPVPPSPRVKASADEITQKLLESYTHRSTYAAPEYAAPADAAARRRPTADPARAHRPAVVPRDLSTGEGGDSPTPHRGRERSRMPLVERSQSPRTTSGDGIAAGVGDPLPTATLTLARPLAPVPGLHRDEPRHDRGADLVVTPANPRGGGAPGGNTPGSKQPDPALHATAGDTAGGRLGGMFGSEEPGPGPQRQQDASASHHGLQGSVPLGEPRTGIDRLGGPGGSAGPGGGDPAGASTSAAGPGRAETVLGKAYAAVVALTRKLLAALPRALPPRARGLTAAEATKMMEASYPDHWLEQLKARERELTRRKKPPSAPLVELPPPVKPERGYGRR